MTEEETEGLPTAAVVQAWYAEGAEKPTSYDVELIGQHNQPTTADPGDLKLDFSDGDELVRREDVEQLIQNKIDEKRLNKPDALKHELLEEQHKIHVLQELLEEVQNR